MDHLTEAKKFAGSQATAGADGRRWGAILAIAHALIALCERLDEVTGHPRDGSGKAIRTISK